MGFSAIIAGGLGAIGSIGSSLIGSNAASNASAQQVAMQEQALQQQQALYNQGVKTQAGYVSQAQNVLSPYMNAGASVLPTLQGLITPGPNQNALLAQTPGFQFASQYGTMAARNALAAQGLGASAGPLATAISQYNNGLAQNTWGNLVSALQNYAGLGSNAASAFGTIAGNAGNAALGSSISAGNSQAGTLSNIGTSQAQGTLGAANALSGGLTGTANALSNATLFNALGSGGGLYGGVGNLTGNSNAVGAGTDAQYNAWALQNGLTLSDIQ